MAAVPGGAESLPPRRTDFLPVYERINEMAAAHALLSDFALHAATIAFERPIVAARSLIDFTVWWPDGRTLYIEVKTVHPRTKDSERPGLTIRGAARTIPRTSTISSVRIGWAGSYPETHSRRGAAS